MALLALAVVLLGITLQLALARSDEPQPAAGEVYTPQPAAGEEYAPQPAPTPPPPEDRLLTLVNRNNPIPEDWEVQLTDIGDGYQLDARCAGALFSMLEACRAAGNRPIVCSAYRTMEEQTELYENKISRLIDEGAAPEDAPAAAAMSVAYPGTSEHQLGLAADIIDGDYVVLDEGQERTSTQRWLIEHCAEYGFILRYPNGATEITGIIYEPWHYRYVGTDHALEIQSSGLTLEEYIG